MYKRNFKTRLIVSTVDSWTLRTTIGFECSDIVSESDYQVNIGCNVDIITILVSFNAHQKPH